MSSAMLSGVHSAREHVPQRADVRDRPPSMTYNEPHGQYGDVTGQYRERESTSRDPFRAPATVKHTDSTQVTPPGPMMPPWNNIPGQSLYFLQRAAMLALQALY